MNVSQIIADNIGCKPYFSVCMCPYIFVDMIMFVADYYISLLVY